MIIDHVGVLFFPDVTIFRSIGRMAFPLFSWGIANGAVYTKDLKKYISRMLIFALISQIPFYLFFRSAGDYPKLYLNVLFTFVISAVIIFLIKKTQNKLLWLIYTYLGMVLAVLLNTDYNLVGVLSTVLFYVLYKENKFYLLLPGLILLYPLSLPVLMFYAGSFSLNELSYYVNSNLHIFPILISLFMIFLYKEKSGPKIKYLFYTVYPLQFLALYLIKILLN